MTGKFTSVQRTTLKPGQQPFALHRTGCRDLRKEHGYQDSFESTSVADAVANVLKTMGNESHTSVDVHVLNCAWLAEWDAKYGR